MKMPKRFAWLVLIIGLCCWYLYSPYTIDTYDPVRDRAALLYTFDVDWYWLIDVERDAYDPAYVIDNRMPDSISQPGTLIIKVLHVWGTYAGFIAYYLQDKTTAVILFLDVLAAYRHKSYGKKLIEYAMTDIKTRGAKRIQLVTRTSNTRARKLYNAAGFCVSRIHDSFIFLQCAL